MEVPIFSANLVRRFGYFLHLWLTTSFPEIVLTLSNGIYPLGGVYNSPAAAIYWKERFGDLFSGGQGDLREIQLQVRLGSRMCLNFMFINRVQNCPKWRYIHQLNLSQIMMINNSIYHHCQQLRHPYLLHHHPPHPLNFSP